MSKVDTSKSVRMHRQTGPDYRVRKVDVECSMRDKTVLQKIYSSKFKSYAFSNKIYSMPYGSNYKDQYQKSDNY